MTRIAATGSSRKAGLRRVSMVLRTTLAAGVCLPAHHQQRQGAVLDARHQLGHGSLLLSS